jgi:propanediol dehydratase small subunit
LGWGNFATANHHKLNFVGSFHRRGAELIAIPDEVLLDLYELLRPGRANSANELRTAADDLRRTYGAEETARLIEEAAVVYERRHIFQHRY